MAISRKEFNAGSFGRRAYSRIEHPVFKLLAKHPNQAFTAVEISNLVRMKEATVRSMLAELISDSLIVHKTPYWAVKQKSGK
jgi:predicted transcriptional regulator